MANYFNGKHFVFHSFTNFESAHGFQFWVSGHLLMTNIDILDIRKVILVYNTHLYLFIIISKYLKWYISVYKVCSINTHTKVIIGKPLLLSIFFLFGKKYFNN